MPVFNVTYIVLVYLDFESVQEKIQKLKEQDIPLIENITITTPTTKNIPKDVKLHPVTPFDLCIYKDLSIIDRGIIKQCTLKFLEFPSKNICDFINYVKGLKLNNNNKKENNLLERFGGNKKKANATGGGAYKYSTLLKEKLGLEILKCDEMKTHIIGLNFLLTTPGICDEEVFTFRNKKIEYVSFKVCFFKKKKLNF